MRTRGSSVSSVCGLHAATAFVKSMSWAKIGSARDARWVTGMPRQLRLLLKRRRSGRLLMQNRPMRGIPLGGTRHPVRSRSSCGARTVSRAASRRRRPRQRQARCRRKDWSKRAEWNMERSWRSQQRTPRERQPTQMSPRPTLGAKRSTSVAHQRNAGDCLRWTTGC